MAHIVLNGIDYNLDESGEGRHYSRSSQPLRPPNSQTVQGSSGQFQLRPDLLQWSWTDWSGGENQIKFDPADPGRAYLLQNVNPFRKRGELALGYNTAVVQDSTGASDFAVAVYLVKAHNTLYGIGTAADDVYKFDGTKFGALEDITSATAASDPNSATGDDSYLFVHETGTTKIHRRDSAGTWTNHNDQCGLTGEVIMVNLGAYVYIWELITGKVYEISKVTANTATPEVEVHIMPLAPNLSADKYLMAAGDNRIYVVAEINGDSYVHEIIPSSAAGTGFGSELAVIRGLGTECVFYNSGTLYLVGWDAAPTNNVGPDRQVFYLDPSGSYGTLGSVRGFTTTNGPSAVYAVPAGGRLATAAFSLPGTWEEEAASAAIVGLFEVDQVTGGMALVGSDGSSAFGALAQINSLLYHQGKYYFAKSALVGSWDTAAVEAQEVGYAISPSNDFSIAGQKILEKLELVCDPLPAGTDITVGYSLDGAAWVDASIVTATSAVGGALQISTDSATKTFRSLKVRIKLTPASNLAPVVKSLDVYARVNRRLRVWDLIIDLADDDQSGYNGAKKLTKLAAIAENTVVPFIDKYLSHDAEDGGTSLDVVVDQLDIVFSQSGEGQAQVRLVEVY